MCSGQKEEAEDEMGNAAEGQVKEDLAGFVEFFLLRLNFPLHQIHQGTCYECMCQGTPRLAKDWGLNPYL